jgi:hypothetical protein
LSPNVRRLGRVAQAVPLCAKPRLLPTMCRESETINTTVGEHLPMARLLSADAVLLGRLSSYTIGKELHRAADEGAVYLARSVQWPPTERIN